MKDASKLIILMLCVFMTAALMGCTQIPEETQGTVPTSTQQPQPETVPVPSISDTLLIPELPSQDELTSTDPQSPDEWVFTNYDHTVSWRDPQGQFHTMTLKLPALTPAADFAVAYNRSVDALAQLLFDEIRFSYEKGYHPGTLSLTYEASFTDETLFVVMERCFSDGSCMYYVDAFDLDDRESLYIGEITEELTELDYPTFLLAAEDLIRQEFIRHYEPMIKELEKEENAYGTVPTEPDGRITDYYNILERFPYLTLYLSQTRIFADADGQLMLYICTPDTAYIPSIRGLIPFDTSALSWEMIPTEDQAYAHLLDLQYYVDGIHADAYSIMLTEAFFSDPEEFTEYAALESSESIARIIGFFKYNLHDGDLAKFIAVCRQQLLDNELTQKEQAFLRAALDALH